MERDGDFWVAYNEQSGLTGSGVSEDEAEANLKHAFIAYCQALRKQGILEQRLTEKGIRFEAIHEEKEKRQGNKGRLSPVLVV